MDKVQDWAWPLVAIFAILTFRQPLIAFLSAAGGRVSKLKVFEVEIELASSGGADKALGDLTPARAADASASESFEHSFSAQHLEQEVVAELKSTDPAEYSVIDIGAGDEWIASRLYLGAALMERMRRLQAFVFVENAAGVEQRFVALAGVREVRWGLAQKFPWLEAAWVKANLGVFEDTPQTPVEPDPRTLPAKPSPFVGSSGAFDAQRVEGLVQRYLGNLQNPPNPVDTTRGEWTVLEGRTVERGEAVTTKLLKSILPPSAFEASAPEMRDEPSARQIRAVFRRRGDFVALVLPDGRLSRVVNRRKMLEDLAEDASVEPEA